MYSREVMDYVLSVYDEIGNVNKTVKTLKYPSRGSLQGWIKRREAGTLPEIKEIRIKKKRRKFTAEMKRETIQRCIEQNLSPIAVAKELGVENRQIYTWHRKLQEEGLVGALPKKKPPQANGATPSDAELMKQMKAEMRHMQMQIDILNETLKVLKKGPGVIPSQLKNSEKVVIVDAIREKYSLPELLGELQLKRSSYYYHKSRKDSSNPYEMVRGRLRELFKANHRRYGYRRLKVLLQREEIRISEKIIRRLMKAERLVAKGHKRLRYNSYLGEVSPPAPNLLERDFHADAPNRVWLTDITEFAIPAGKVYLSPIIDCYDGLVVSRSMGVSPNADLANKSLDLAVLSSKGAKPIIHSDRGAHYRWPGWLKRIKKYGLTRSMSKKGCSPDNAACEGFFGRLKNECFYDEDFNGYSIQAFIRYIDEYIDWYNDTRIKVSLNQMSPREFRRSKGYCA